MNDVLRMTQSSLAAACLHAERVGPFARAVRAGEGGWTIEIHENGAVHRTVHTDSMEDGDFPRASSDFRLIEAGLMPAPFAKSVHERANGWLEHPDGSFTVPLLAEGC